MIKGEFDILTLENKIIDKIINNLYKRNFKIRKFKVEKNLARYIEKIYKEIKLIKSNYYKFLITEKLL